jgi:hypothetical protein
VENIGKMTDIFHGICVSVENIGKMIGLLHRMGILVEKTVIAYNRSHLPNHMNYYI